MFKLYMKEKTERQKKKTILGVIDSLAGIWIWYSLFRKGKTGGITKKYFTSMQNTIKMSFMPNFIYL